MELKEKLAKLEQENARLKQKNQSAPEFRAREDTYQGHPVLTFEGPTLARPFSLGVRKLAAIKVCWHNVENFLINHGNTNSERCANDVDSKSDKI